MYKRRGFVLERLILIFLSFISICTAGIAKNVDDFDMEKLWFDEKYYKQNPYKNDAWYVNYTPFSKDHPNTKDPGYFENFPVINELDGGIRTCSQNDYNTVKDFLKGYTYKTSPLHVQDFGNGVQYYLAHDYTKNGYKFCKTYIGAQSTTIYYYYSTASGWDKDCFWLCKPGYFSDGNGCTSTKMVDTSEPDMSLHTKRQKYANGKIQPLKEVDFRHKSAQSDVLVLSSDFVRVGDSFLSQSYQNLFCPSSRGDNRAQSIHFVLGIKNIEIKPSDNTVIYTVQPFAIRAGNLDLSWVSWPLVQFIKTKSDNTMCPGNMMHKSGGGCVAVVKGSDNKSENKSNDVVAAEAGYQAAQSQAKSEEEKALDMLCHGWKKSAYNNKIHTLKPAEGKYVNYRVCTPNTPDGDCAKNHWSFGGHSDTCVIFECKNGLGYTDHPGISGVFTCVDCDDEKNSSNKIDDEFVHPSRRGVRYDGQCYTCEAGYFMKNGRCEPTKNISKYDMAGIRGTSDNTDRNIKEQCWTKTAPREYLECLEDAGLLTQ